MGLPYSTEKILGWRSQYEAVERWYQRCEKCHVDNRYTSHADATDFILAFFVFCYHLRDYVIETGNISACEIDSLIDNNFAMRICRDVCLRAKHHTISNKGSVKRSVDIDWSLGREYDPWPSGKDGEKLFLIAGDKFDAMDIVNHCRKFWKDLVESGKLKEPQNPFRSKC